MNKLTKFFIPIGFLLLGFIGALEHIFLTSAGIFSTESTAIYGSDYLAFRIETLFIFVSATLISFTIQTIIYNREKSDGLDSSSLISDVGQRLRKRKTLFIAFTLILIIFVGFTEGPSMWRRTDYIETRGSVGIFTSGILLVSGLICSLIRPRILAHIFFIIFFIAAISKASRVAALIPFTYYIFGMLFDNKRRRSILRLVLFTCLSLWAYGLALHFRNLPSHGLSNYIHEFPLSGDLFIIADEIFVNLASNYLAIAATIAKSSADFDLNYLRVIIDPRRGGSAGWDEISDQFRIHRFIPYSGYGELYKISPIALLVSIATFSAIYAKAFCKITRARSLVELSYLGALLCTLAAFLLLFSYNARSGFRWIYLALIIYVLAGIISKSSNRTKRQ